MLEERTELSVPEVVDSGEALYVNIHGMNAVYVCSVEIEFSRPG